MSTSLTENVHGFGRHFTRYRSAVDNAECKMQLTLGMPSESLSSMACGYATCRETISLTLGTRIMTVAGEDSTTLCSREVI